MKVIESMRHSKRSTLNMLRTTVVIFMILIINLASGINAVEPSKDVEEERPPSLFRDNSMVKLLSSVEDLEEFLDQVRHPKMDSEQEAQVKKNVGEAYYNLMMKEQSNPNKARTNPNGLCFFVLFYTDWCKNCLDLIPHFDEAASELFEMANYKEKDPLSRLVLAAVDISSEENRIDAKQLYGISQYPSLKWFRGGFYSDDYPGSMPVESPSQLISWAKNRMVSTTEAVTSIETLSDAKTFIEDTAANGEVAVIGFLDAVGGDFATGFAYSQFQRFAVDIDKIKVGAMIGQGSGVVAHALQATDRPPLIMAFRNTETDFVGESSSLEYDGPFLERMMRFWLDEIRRPRLLPFHDEYYQWDLLGKSPIDQELLGLIFTSDTLSSSLAESLIKVDETLYPPTNYTSKAAIGSTVPLFVRNVKFVRIEDVATSEESKSMSTFYGVPQSELPYLVFINVTDIESKRWRYGKLEESSNLYEDILAFASQVIDNEIEPELRGEAIPQSNEMLNVKVAVRENWDELVGEQESDDVLVLLHTEQGEASATLMEAFQILGDFLFNNLDVKRLSLVTVDVLNNAISGFEEIPYTPAVFLFPPKHLRNSEDVGDNESGLSMYMGGPNVNDLIAFLKKKVTVATIPEDAVHDEIVVERDNENHRHLLDKEPDTFTNPSSTIHSEL